MSNDIVLLMIPRSSKGNLRTNILSCDPCGRLITWPHNKLTSISRYFKDSFNICLPWHRRFEPGQTIPACTYMTGVFRFSPQSCLELLLAGSWNHRHTSSITYNLPLKSA